MTGAVGGVASDLEVKGRYKFDLESRRIVWLALLVQERRSIGHVAGGEHGRASGGGELLGKMSGAGSRPSLPREQQQVLDAMAEAYG